MARRADMIAWRNVPFPPDEIALSTGGAPLNLTGKTAAMDVRLPNGGAVVISLDMAASPSSDGIRFTDPTGGVLIIQIDQPSLQAAYDAAVAAGLVPPGGVAELDYDLLLIGADEVPEVILEGRFIIHPGRTAA